MIIFLFQIKRTILKHIYISETVFPLQFSVVNADKSCLLLKKELLGRCPCFVLVSQSIVGPF